jgi:transposase
VHEAPSPSRVHPVSQCHRGQSAEEKDDPVIVDNYAAHKHPDVIEWLEKHRRFVFHFTPTSASWLNAIEGFFAKLTKKHLKRGVFRSLQELKDPIHDFLDDTNTNPKPFVWTKDPNKIIVAVRRGHQVLDSIH